MTWSWSNWPWTRARPAAWVGGLATAQAALVARIHAESFAHPWDAHEIERMIADPMVVADAVHAGSERTPCGFVLSRCVLDEAEILTIAVTGKRRGEGLARALLMNHMPRLAARGVLTLHLEVEEGNAAARRLYEHLGFGEVGRRANYYAKADGSRAAALLLSRSLA